MDIDDLTGKMLAIPRGFAVHSLLVRGFPGIKLVLCDSDEQALEAVATAKADAYIGNLTVATHIIQRRGFYSLRVVAPTPFGDHELAMGNRKDWPALTSMINKVLTSITEEEKTAIRNKYLSIRYEQGISRAYVLKWALVLGGGALCIVFLFILWNRSLTKKVKEHTSELADSNASLEAEIRVRKKAEDALRKSRDYLKNLTDSMGDAVLSVKMPERTIEWANDTFNVFGYDSDECLGQTTEFLYRSRKDFLAFGDQIADAIATGKKVFHLEQILRKKNAEVFPADITLSFYGADGRVDSLTAIVRDISERKQREQQLQAHQQRLKALVSELTVAEERERRRIAVDLHDRVGQELALARMQLAAMSKSITDAGLSATIDDISDSLIQTIKDTRHLIYDLKPPGLDELGLAAALSEWVEEHIETRHGLKARVINDGLAEPLGEEVRTFLFRSVRELLNNTVKHAQATSVSVRLEQSASGVQVIVQDDGVGFDYRTASKSASLDRGFGLFSLQERIADLGGTMEIVSEPGKGFEATLKVPVDKP